MPPSTSRLVAAVAGTVGGAAAYVGLATGSVSLDTGIGRRTRSLGPITVVIDAPRVLVFDVIAAPYLGRPGAAADHIRVLERGTDLVVAAHRTPIAGGIVATTIEAVGFRRPDQVTFRLLRGPVPHVRETFALDEADGATRLHYDGELGTDLWSFGAAWGGIVARVWERTVRASLDGVRERAEERAESQRRREGTDDL